MAGRGPAPQGAHQRERDTKRRITSQQIVVVDDGEDTGPTIEDATLVSDWSPQVRAWWADWRRSPQAKAFLATDWRTLAMLAPLVERQVLRPSGAIAAEIRLVHANLGATVQDRARLRMIVEVDDREAAPVVRLASSREDVAARMRGEA